MNANLLKLASLIFKFQKVKTDKAELTINGEIVVGADVLITNEQGELVQAEDGDYKTENLVITVVGGKVAEINEVKEDDVIEEVVDEVKEEEVIEEQPKEDDKDIEIAELKKAIEEKDNLIVELQNKIQELENEINKPVEEPIEMSSQVGNTNDNIFKEYFK